MRYRSEYACIYMHLEAPELQCGRVFCFRGTPAPNSAIVVDNGWDHRVAIQVSCTQKRSRQPLAEPVALATQLFVSLSAICPTSFRSTPLNHFMSMISFPIRPLLDHASSRAVSSQDDEHRGVYAASDQYDCAALGGRRLSPMACLRPIGRRLPTPPIHRCPCPLPGPEESSSRT
jgi:hypothetical protein